MLTRPAAAAKRRRGVTLIELTVVLAVLALVLMLSMPSIGRWLDNTRIRNAAEALQSGLQTARQEAVRRNQHISFYLVSSMNNSCTLSSSSGSWVINADSPAGECAGAMLAKRAIGDAGGRVAVSAGHSTDTSDKTTMGSAATTLTFDGLGRVANIGDGINRIRVTGPDANTAYLDLMLIVEAGGGVRMCDPRSSVATNDPRKC
ncbi:hypothetical protein APR50_24095 [Variovorax paradoxus]|jgi:type IV fimbrial biogenesis protein FimT|uniref:GspH/FimT family pseudopilin n=1 Tax=Variovorax paradoxus TaxID=34073 RepID=UPI0006E4CBB3|nr:hypothetical protein APR52_28975 [Variovorax paradoxus]KPV03667.1 hypothetical protein APR50_24095 [Variovorax paradoxus]KPV06052.1 hypothetical protein APR49_20590 [Variovorax paradoxus]KPV19068.1 hypothetical protein APR51_21555 [Variovorax paradoxus]KPV29801.1 hypothetical protein APR48_21620 [Variovorax paradoxus]